MCVCVFFFTKSLKMCQFKKNLTPFWSKFFPFKADHISDRRQNNLTELFRLNVYPHSIKRLDICARSCQFKQVEWGVVGMWWMEGVLFVIFIGFPAHQASKNKSISQADQDRCFCKQCRFRNRLSHQDLHCLLLRCV